MYNSSTLMTLSGYFLTFMLNIIPSNSGLTLILIGLTTVHFLMVPISTSMSWKSNPITIAVLLLTAIQIKHGNYRIIFSQHQLVRTMILCTYAAHNISFSNTSYHIITEDKLYYTTFMLL